jgi:hypothetical protein
MALPTIAPAATPAVTVLIRALRPSLCNRGTAMVPLYRSADFRHLLQAPTSVVVRRDAAIDRTEDLDVQICEEANQLRHRQGLFLMQGSRNRPLTSPRVGRLITARSNLASSRCFSHLQVPRLPR